MSAELERMTTYTLAARQLEQVGFIGADGEMVDLARLTVRDMREWPLRTSNPHWSPLFRFADAPAPEPLTPPRDADEHADWCGVNNYNAPYPCNCRQSRVERLEGALRALVAIIDIHHHTHSLCSLRGPKLDAARALLAESTKEEA